MKRLQARILFVLPKTIESQDQVDSADEAESPIETPRRGEPSRAPGRLAGHLEVASVPSEITNPYGTQPANPTPRLPEKKKSTVDVHSRKPESSSVRVLGVGAEDGYDGDLMGKIRAYADRCASITRRELFDVIHAHDWMTFPAAIEIARYSGRPLVVHVHATEFDRSGEHINRSVYEIEQYGMHAAAAVIAVSERTKQIIVQRYGVSPEKIHVVHNGIETGLTETASRRNGRREKVVLFLGRITMQKGPEFFVRAAARVAARTNNVRFVVAGTGDMLPYIIGLAKELGLENRIEFTGFLHGGDVDKAYQMADVYAMPSVSEPFGLTALEAVRHGVPVILSKNSGAAEVLKRGALKVDFWDVEMLAKMIILVLQYPRLAETLRREGAGEIGGLTWDVAARKCLKSYYDVLRHNGDSSRFMDIEAVHEELSVVGVSC